jgi:AhpD family alkylhydroperoxidase
MYAILRKSALALAVFALTVAAAATIAPASDAKSSAAATYADMEKTLGFVPDFFKAFPESGISGAWEEFKTIQLDPNTALSNKDKQLIGLAVSAQVPCQYCIYFHSAAAKANGASDEEIKEAVAMAAVTRHWSTVLNGMQVDLATFKQQTNRVLGLSQ